MQAPSHATLNPESLSQACPTPSPSPSPSDRVYVSYRAEEEEEGHMRNLFWLGSPAMLMWIFQFSYMENSMSLTLLFYALVRACPSSMHW